MLQSKFILKKPQGGAAYEVSFQDLRLYLDKGDIGRDWLTRRVDQRAWYHVGSVLEGDESVPLNSKGRPFDPANMERAEPEQPDMSSTMAMFEAEPVATPKSITDQLGAFIIPVKIACPLVGLLAGAAIAKVFADRTGIVITGAVIGGGLGFFAGYMAGLLLTGVRQTLLQQEQIAAKLRQE